MAVDDPRNDPLLLALTRLPGVDVSPHRAEQLRQRCHRAMGGRNRLHALENVDLAARMQRAFEPVFVTLACAAFLSEILRRTLLLLR
jgi:hypothetical protein